MVQKGGTGNLLSIALMFTVVGFGFKVAVVPFHLWGPRCVRRRADSGHCVHRDWLESRQLFHFAESVVHRFQRDARGRRLGRDGVRLDFPVGGHRCGQHDLGELGGHHPEKRQTAAGVTEIAHAGYIFVGFVAANQTGQAAVLFYIIVYSLTNLGAFGVIVALADRAGGEDMKHFNGMARRAPLLSLLLLIFILSLAGIPPLGGFFGKFYLFAAAVQNDPKHFGLLWLVILGIVMSAVSLYYYLVLLKHVYVHKTNPNHDSRIETPTYLNVTLSAVALTVVGMGVFPERVLALLKGLVERL